MIRVVRHDRPLSARETWFRVVAIAIISFGAVALRAVNPETVSWLAMQKSCGAFTGLPCIFCGTTRAVHLLLNAEYARALYFNWLAFPVAMVGVVAVLLFASELLRSRRLVRVECFFTATPRVAVLGATALVVLWAVQVALALAFHKHELLNSSAPLYALFVR